MVLHFRFFDFGLLASVSNKYGSRFSLQIVKNLVFLAKTLQILLSENISRVANGQDKSATHEETVAGEGGLFTLKDLLSNMNKLATLEASQTPKHTQKVRFESCSLFYISKQ